ncbi:sensor histidine kinase [Robiginitalea sp. IMCC44478]|uniref:sensor histidine kinase n=1 Tax=Robiginitalea sp. IMCC44478 TaxID=3459122 RepID=UPI0040418DBE
MNPNLNKLKDVISASKSISPEKKEELLGQLSETENLLAENENKLLSQQRELEIETALERVRARSMAMQSSDEISEVLSLLFQQFDLLGIKPLTVWLTLWNPDKNTFIYQSTGTSGHRIQAQQEVAIEGMQIWQDLYEKWKRGDSEDVELLFYSQEDARQLFSLMQETFSAMPEEERLTAEHFPEGGYSVQGHCKFGYIGYTHTRKPTEEEIDILTRFATEFGRVYQRFLDIQKAEAQAREAQIEASLERVRAASMAMHKTADIASVVQVLFEELKQLNIPFEQAWINIFHLEEGYFDIWFSPLDGIYEEPTHFKMPTAPFEETAIKSWRSGATFSYTSLKTMAEVDQFMEACDQITDSNYFTILQKKLKNNRLEFLEARHNYGFLSKTTVEEPTEEDKTIMERFAKVFEQAYTRFLDIQKAEQQARESQIEAALERVRAQSLAMHSTSEMQLVANAIYEQLSALGIEMDAVGMSGAIEAKQDYDVWVGGAPMGEALRIPYNEETKVQRDYNKMLRDRPELFARTYSGKVKKEYIDRLLTHGEFPKALKKKMVSSEAFTTLIAPKKNSGIQIVRYTDQAYTEQDAEILKRFAGVFEQAYIRFMDLEKAEKQARESQIEAALERVRARTMAMHKSTELGEVAAVLFEQISKLVHTPERFNIAIGNKEGLNFDIWVTDQKGYEVNKQFTFHVDQSPVVKEVYEAWGKKPYIVQHLHGKKLEQWISYMHREVGIPFDKTQLKEHRYINSVFFAQGCIGITTNEPPAQESLEIIGRFAKVFEQTYTRFLDLQKAELQAREAEIQLALERIRARAMAMQGTEELGDVLCVLFEQFDFLGINPALTHLTLFDEENKTFSLRITTSPSNKVLAEQIIDIEAVESWKASYENWKNGGDQTVDCIEYPPEILPAVWEIMDVVMTALPEGHKIYPSDFPDGLFTTQGHCRFGYIGMNHTRPATEEEKVIVGRFASEFGMVYQRFLELKRAEAQAREAQIEAALERVRARSMAMHKSDELLDLSVVLFQELDKLEVRGFFNCGFVEVDEGEQRQSGWTTMTDGSMGEGYFLPLRGDKVLDDRYQAWKIGEPAFCQKVGGQELKAHMSFAMPTLGSERIRQMTSDFPDPTYFYCFNFSHGYLSIISGESLSGEAESILIRFTRAFEQAYIRFMDLKKAEAQARESEIQLALERVRARTMAMHRSDELSEVAAELFQQIEGLGATPERLNIGIVREDEGIIEWWSTQQGGQQINQLFTGSIEEPTTISKLYKAWKEGKKHFELRQKGKELRQWLKYLQEEIGLPFEPELVRDQRFHTAAYFKHGLLLVSAPEPVSAETRELLFRFSQVFEQTYVRFLDLQKAEAQAREAQIEASMERIRARAMAMQESTELTEVLSVIFQQLNLLGVDTVWTHLTLLHPEENAFTYRMTGRNGERIIAEEKISLDASEHWKHISDDIKSADKDPDPITRIEFPPEGLEAIWELFDGIFSKLPEGEKVAPRDFPNGLYTTQAYCKFGFLGLNQIRESTPEEADILMRFTTEFSRLYQRFLDLQNAEERAREAQIEAALEKVRGRSLAMHNSSELQEVIKTVYDQFLSLQLDISGGAFITVNEDIDRELLCWGAGGAADYIERVHIPFLDMPIYTEILKGIKKGPGFFTESFTQKEKKAFFEELFKNPPYKNTPSAQKKEILGRPGGYTRSCAVFKHTSIFIINHHGKPFSEQDNDVLKRMGRVFEQAYTRFLDLQKAEKQAREAQIEAALERVRARSMAMHHSKELTDLNALLLKQIDGLQVKVFAVGIHIVNPEKPISEAWIGDPTVGQMPKIVVDHEKDPLTRLMYKGWKDGEELIETKICGEQVKEHFDNMHGVHSKLQFFKPNELPQCLYYHFAYFLHGFFVFVSTCSYPENYEIFKRIAKVFEQTYIRFLDLQKAEAQARESQIEAALERIRAKTMAMHNTDDIANTVITFFEELLGLGLDKSMRAGIGILSQSDLMEVWTASIPETSKTILHKGSLDMTTHPLLVGAKRAWDQADPFFTYKLEGEDLIDYFRNLTEAPDYPAEFDLDKLPEIVNHRSIPFADGFLFTFTESPLPDEIIRILERFATVFGQTYTRYLDLQKAEERAGEALKQASIERIRGEISSMRSAADLKRITPLVWNELTTLGVPFFRCGVFIVNEKEKKILSFLSNPEGESLAAWQIGFGVIPVFDEMVKSWQMQEVFCTEWDRQGFLDFSRQLTEHGLVDNQERYQSGKDAPEHLVLHMLPFNQGMLYVGSQVQLDTDQMELVQSLANAFSVAYARYEDFNQLEKTLADLKATQNQLVQSEKMASLGELTAGIAHEIKNPLNFVNNFSEVSKELLEELQEELARGDMEEVKTITADLIQNLEKIVHHGQRADGIVRGMLQHSRSGDGKKEPTDINVLADEYLRLAYHGLRAKDKSFNATIETAFDERIDKIELVPQDIGRVLLNLLTNAFYAVNEKNQELKGTERNSFTPTVWVNTRKKEDKVLISIKDNGKGISETVLAKIFQPFFTTKPTGQGTGLGLSLSYDIIKAHGGDIAVESEENQFTEFTINLPLS